MGLLFAAMVWVVLAVAYLLFAGQASGTELLAGLGASLLAAAYAAAAHRAAHDPYRLRLAWPRIIGATLRALPVDSLRVALALLTGRPGRLQRQAFAGGEAAAAGRRAVAVLALSLAPNGYVVQAAPEELRLHRLRPVPPSADRELPL